MHRIPCYNYSIGPESVEAQHRAGRYNPADVLYFAGRAFTLACGSSDTVDVFEDKDYIYILNTNSGIGYIGFEVYSKVTARDFPRVHSLFWQGGQVEESGLNVDWSAPYLARKCAEIAFELDEEYPEVYASVESGGCPCCNG